MIIKMRYEYTEKYPTVASYVKWKYFRVQSFSDTCAELCVYPESKEEEYSTDQKIERRFFVNKEDKDTLKLRMKLSSGHGDGATYTFYELEDNPEKYKLIVHKQYTGFEKLEHIVKKDALISDEMVKEIQDKSFIVLRPIIIIGEDFSKMNVSENYMKGYHYREIQPYIKLYCTICGHTYFPKIVKSLIDEKVNASCPYCQNHKLILETSDYHKSQEENFTRYYTEVKQSLTDSNFYLKVVDNGILIYRIVRRVSADNGKFIEEFKVNNVVSHIIGGDIGAYRSLKNGKKPCDVFEALHINSKSVTSIGHIMYEGYTDFIDFSRNNQDFLKKSGFLEISKYARNIVDIESFFVLFIAIMNKYPILEQVVKMGYIYLFFDLYSAIIKSESKNEISDIVSGLSELVNNETTKGKYALRFPGFIGDYLKSKSAKLNEYYVWRDIFELTNITKEQFLEVINSFEYMMVAPYVNLSGIANVLKFGYTVPKLLTYLLKDVKTADDIRTRLEYLSDYLNMCDVMQVTIDLYPSDLYKVHDELAKQFKVSDYDKRDNQLHMIASMCENYILKNIDTKEVGIPKLLEDYVIIFPYSVKDLVDECNQMHNCVGWYADLILKGKSVVFFIRKKETPEKSFITAECVKTGLGQFYYSNNRTVTNKELKDLGKWVAGKILRGCKSGSIPALHSIRITG